jgi:hypothetical protein
MAKCDDVIKEIVGTDLSLEEIKELGDALRKKKAQLETEGKLDQTQEEITKLVQQNVEDIEIARLQRKRNLYNNLLLERGLIEQMKRAYDATGKPGKAIAALLGGLNVRFDGAMRSVDAAINGIHRNVAGRMIAEIEEAGLLHSFLKMEGDFEREVGRAIAALNGGENVGKFGKEAQELAKIMHRAQENMRRKKNLFGGYVRAAKGYIVRQTHNRNKVAATNRQVWKDTIRAKLDYEKMEIPVDEIDRFLDSAYDAISTGVRKNRDRKTGKDVVDKSLDVVDSIFTYSGPGNLAKKVSASRTLIFKSPDDWYDYNNDFGNGSLKSTFMEDLRSSARDVALMQQLGTNPQAMLDRVITRGEEIYRNDPEALKSLQQKKQHFQNLYDEVSGQVDISMNETAATWGRRIRAVQTMAKLGGSVISAFSDIAALAAARQYQGRGLFESWMDAFTAPLKGLAPGQAKGYLRSAGIGIDGLIGDFQSRFNANDDFEGQTSKLMQLYFKINLLQPWTDANKRAIGQMLSNEMATEGNLPFSQLTPERQNLFNIYGIDAERWDVIRASAGKADDGNMYIQTGNIKVPNTGRFKKMTKTGREKYVAETQQMITSLFLNEADIAVPTPGARERAIIRMGLKPGSGPGEAVRYMMQFKSFSVTIMTKVIGRQTHGYGANGVFDSKFYSSRGLAGLANFIALSSALGLLSYQSKQMLKGREPRELDAKTIMAGFLQGGGLGIYGDFLFAEYNRFGGGILETLAGPTAGTFSETIDLLNKTKTLFMEDDFEFSKVGPEGLNLIKSNTPFMNIFYTKQAFDYLIFHHLQEMMRPGYLKRHERTLEREYDQEYMTPPSSIIKRGGGFQ